MLNAMEGIEGGDMEEIQEEVNTEEPQFEEDEVALLMHAMCDKQAYNTIKIKGCVGKKPLTILIDSRSIYSFLDSGTDTRTKVAVSRAIPLAVIVANRQKTVPRCLH